MITIALLINSSLCFADRTGGGSQGGGGGRLGQVSAGLGTATASSSASSSRGSGGNGGSRVASDAGRNDCARYRIARERDPAYENTLLEHRCVVLSEHETYEPGGSNPTEPGAHVEGFAGGEKVVGSDGSLSVALAVVDSRMRLDGSFTQYYETEMNGDRITMMQPELTGGVRITPEASATRVWLQGGVMYLKTSDPRGSSSVTGPSIGARVEQRMSPELSLLGIVEGGRLEDGVTAWAGRVGVRFHHVEAAFRVLDLNVGPALYGPELGVGF